MKNGNKNVKKNFINTLLGKPFTPYFLLFIAILGVSCAAIIVVKLQEYEIAPEISAMYRTLFAGTGALLLSTAKKDVSWIVKRSTLNRIHWIIFSGIFLAIHFATWFLSLAYVSVSISTTLVDTVPIFLAILGFIFFKEKINLYGIVGIFFAVSGSIALSFSTQSDNVENNPLVGIILAFCGALTVSFYFIIGKKILVDSPLWPYFALVNLISGTSLFIYNLLRDYSLTWNNHVVLLYLTLLALVPSLIGHATYNFCLKKLPAYIIGVAILGEPIGATILGIMFLKQIPNLTTILLVGVILIGIGLTSISPYITRKTKKRRNYRCIES